MLDHGRPRQLRRVAVLCGSGRRGSYLSVPAGGRVQADRGAVAGEGQHETPAGSSTACQFGVTFRIWMHEASRFNEEGRLKLRTKLTAGVGTLTVLAGVLAPVAIAVPASASTGDYVITPWVAPDSGLAWTNNGAESRETINYDANQIRAVTVPQYLGVYHLHAASSGNCLYHTSGDYVFESQYGCAHFQGDASALWIITHNSAGRNTITPFDQQNLFVGVWDSPSPGENLRVKAPQSGFDAGWIFFTASTHRIANFPTVSRAKLHQEILRWAATHKPKNRA